MENKTLIFCLLAFVFVAARESGAATQRWRSSSRQAKLLDQDRYFRKYLPIEEIQSFLKTLKESYPHKIRSKLVGVSSRRRKIKLYSITNNSTNCIFRKRNKRQVNVRKPIRSNNWSAVTTDQNKTHNFLHFKVKSDQNSKIRKRQGKPMILIDGGSHSREWVSPASVLYLMLKLAESDEDFTNDIDWKIIPLVNPDGYVQSWKKDRFWRKTMSTTKQNTCFGTDINRNFDIKWGEVDTSSNPCAENFGGSSKHSEPETIAIVNSITRWKKSIEAYISVHNWGQDILYPYSYTQERRPNNEKELRRVGQGMADTITKKQGVTYKAGMSSILLYPASGTALDWAYEVMGIPLSYLIELRDEGKEAFRLHEKHIVDTGEDLYLAMKYLAREILKKYKKIC